MRWSRISRETSSIRVNYGPGKIPLCSETAGGGIIKCQDLAKVFPQNLSDPNILYIVSSSLTPYSVATARFAKRAGAAVVLNQNGVAYPACMPVGWESQNKPMKAIMGLADYVFYQSEFCKISADRFLGAFKGSYEILHNPVDTESFRPKAGKALGNDGLTLLLAGSHAHLSKIKTACETVACLRKSELNVRLIVAGRYSWQEDACLAIQECRRLAGELSVDSRIEFRGAYSQHDVVPLMQEADMLLHPTYNDACPRLVVEAMSCGLPVVYSASGGVPELVGEEGGCGVQAPRDWDAYHPPRSEALADCVRKVAGNYDGYAKAARRRAVARFDVKPWVQRHREVFQQLCR